MSASIYLRGASMGHITAMAERDMCGDIRLHLRNNARCDSAVATLSVAEAWAVVDALTALLPERAKVKS